MKFNISKCKVVHMGNNNIGFGYELSGEWLLNVGKEKKERKFIKHKPIHW